MLDVNTMLKVGHSVFFNKDQTVFNENEAGENMYIVLKGSFGVYINSFAGFPIRMATVETYSYFGEMAVIDGSVRSATVIADEDESVALVVEKEKFPEMLSLAPHIGADILSTLRNRVKDTTFALRKMGMDVPDLPLELKNAQFTDVASGINLMKQMALRLRELNSELSSEVKTPQSEVSSDKSVINLLPEGYTSLPVGPVARNKFVLRMQDVICPHCGQSASAPLPIFSVLEPRDDEKLDGRIIYRSFNILLYTNVVCPRCAYTDTYSEFTKPRKDNYPDFDGSVFENKEGFAGYADDFAHTTDEAVKSYYLSIACIKRTTADSYKLAKAWIRLYWLYSDFEHAELTKESAQNAYNYYKEYMEKNTGSILPKDAMRLYTVLAELSVALGNTAQAGEYYAKVSNCDPALNPTFFERCAERCEELGIEFKTQKDGRL